MLKYQNNAPGSHGSTHVEFFRQLPLIFGASEAAARLSRSEKRRSQIGLVLGLALAGAYFWYRLH